MDWKNKIIVYLDWNVIAEFLDHRFSDLETQLKQFKYSEKVLIPFSSEHVEESSNIKLENEEKTTKTIEDRLEYLSELSSDIYFVNDLIHTGFRVEHPVEVYNTIKEIDLGFNIRQLFVELVDFDSIKMSRELIGISSNELNNISPDKAIQKIDKMLNLYGDKTGQKTSIREIIKGVMEFTEQTHGRHEYYKMSKQKITHDLNNFIIMTFSLLDTFGFWSDRKATYNKGSMFIDCRHAFNGFFANFVISNDKRFCKKSEAVYKYLGSKTIVFNLSSDESQIIEHIKNAT